MGMGQQRPGGKKTHVAWNYLKLQAGGTLKAHLAGDWLGVHTHWASKSEPCRSRVSDGKLPCRLCEAQFACRWQAYVPLIDTSRVRYVVALNEENSIALDSISPGDPVLVAKQRLHGSPLTVRAEAWASPIKIGRGGFPASDLQEWLLHCWKDGELAEVVRSSRSSPRTRPDITLVTPESTITVSGAASVRREEMNAQELAQAKELLRRRGGILNGALKPHKKPKGG